MRKKPAERLAPLSALQQVLALIVVAAQRTLCLLLVIINIAAHVRVHIGVRACRHALVGQLLIILHHKQGDQRPSENATPAERDTICRLPLTIGPRCAFTTHQLAPVAVGPHLTSAGTLFKKSAHVWES